MPVKVYSVGVVRLPLAATYSMEKSWVSRPRSMATAATRAPARISQA